MHWDDALRYRLRPPFSRLPFSVSDDGIMRNFTATVASTSDVSQKYLSEAMEAVAFSSAPVDMSLETPMVYHRKQGFKL